MLYAEHEEEWVKARPGAEATCPMCGEPVKAFCGEIQAWHWRHEHTRDCDSWGDPETKWHRAWKETVRPAYREVTIRGAQATHRADMRTADGLVIELQHSSISSEEIRAREAFYGAKMIWVVDASPFQGHLLFDEVRGAPHAFIEKMGKVLTRRLGRDPSWEDYEEMAEPLSEHYERLCPVAMKWRWERRSWHAAQRPVFLDLSRGRIRYRWATGKHRPARKEGRPLFWWRKDLARPVHGEWGGRFIPREQFVKRYLRDKLPGDQ